LWDISKFVGIEVKRSSIGRTCNSWVGVGGYSVGGWVTGARGGAVWGTIEFPDRGPLLVSKWRNSSISKKIGKLKWDPVK
jgi:hypothetical protein